MNANPHAQTPVVSRRDFLKSSAAFAFLISLGGSFSQPAQAAFTMETEAANYHFLNRISFGVRGADMKRIARIGMPAYLEEQLNPARLLRGVSLPVPAILNLARPKLLKLKNANDLCDRALIRGVVNRAITSPAQLQERVVEFWSDHFNIAPDDIQADYVDFQRTVIRKYALGKFRDLLIATAKHPAMLQYLDNFLNVAEHPNENYAREVMELHTLGVDGGYTEADVKTVARAFTGLTYDYDRVGQGFYFDADSHDLGAKTIFQGTPQQLDLPANRGLEDPNHPHPEQGIQDAIDVLTALANHPSTRAFVCRKLCVRFVSDNPPLSLVNTLAQVWAANDGAIVPVLRALFLSPEFAASRGQKLRRPLDHAIGVMRLAGTRVTKHDDLEYYLATLGQVPYGWHPPNGYPDVAGAWANTNGLLARWNIATNFCDYAFTDPHSGMTTQLGTLIGAPRTVGALVDKVALTLLAQPLDAAWRARLVAFVADGGDENTRLTSTLRRERLGTLATLVFSSPAFQWR